MRCGGQCDDDGGGRGERRTPAMHTLETCEHGAPVIGTDGQTARREQSPTAARALLRGHIRGEKKL